MTKYIPGLFVLCLGLVGFLRHSPAGDLLPDPVPECEAGYMLVEEIGTREVVREVCKTVPDVKKVKKWVYSTVPDNFCLQHTPCHGHHGDCCGEGCRYCEGPYCRNQLAKKLVTQDCPTTKCVVEKVVERVPCTVYRKVPCGLPAPATPQR